MSLSALGMLGKKDEGAPSLSRRNSLFRKKSSNVDGSSAGGSTMSRKLSIRNLKGIKHVAQKPFRFRFEVQIDSIEKLTEANIGPGLGKGLVIVWERSNDLICTPAKEWNVAESKVNFEGFRMARDVTLFRTGGENENSTFNEKIFKFSVRAGNKDGKAVGKIHLNFADYAQVPTGTRKLSANLTNGASLLMTLISTFVAAGKGSKSKLGSQVSGSDFGGSSFGDSGFDDREDDFKDLLDDDDNFPPANSSDMAIANGESISLSAANVDPNDVEGLRYQNDILKRRVVELERKNKQLINDLTSSTKQFPSTSGGTISAAEADKLRLQVENLTEALGREPAFNDLVAELKDTKTKLALLSMEKEEIQFELVQLRAKWAKVASKKK